MALSDCSRCWGTPCTCGNEGYMVVHTKTPAKLKALPEAKYDEIHEVLQKALQDLLDREPG